MATKKTTSKKAPAKKRSSSVKTPQMQSFHVAPRDRPFWTFLFTTQSFYWVLIGASVVAVGVYVATLQLRVNSLYDQLDINSSQVEMNESEIKKLKEAN